MKLSLSITKIIIFADKYREFNCQQMNQDHENKQLPKWRLKLLPWIKWTVLLILISIPLFGGLDKVPIRFWDESRSAINAYEMHQNGNYLIPHFNGEPDMWSTKPPLMIWLQTAAMKIIGVNELAVRLPSAIAAFLTCLLLLLFARSYLKNTLFGIVAVFVLITSGGYIEMHGTRTGDYDALLTLFTTMAGLAFFMFCEYENRQFLYLFFLTSILAVLTKGISGMFFFPSFFIYALVRKKITIFLKNRHFYIGIGLFLFFVCGYYLLRESFNPGYIQAVWQNELGGRLLTVIEGHDHPFLFFHSNFILYRFIPWYFILPLGIIAGFLIKDDKIRKLTLFSFLMALGLFLLISSSQTKLPWYDIPMFPFLALLIAPSFEFLFRMCAKIRKSGFLWLQKALPLFIMVLVFIVPYVHIVKKTCYPQRSHYIKGEQEVDYYLQEVYRGRHIHPGQFLVFEDYGAPHDFYLKMIQEKGIPMEYKSKDKIESGDVIVLFQESVQKIIEQKFEFELLSQEGTVLICKIGEKKTEKPDTETE